MPPPQRRQRGSVAQLPSGSFRVSVFAGHDPLTGRERRLRETAGTYAEAQKVRTRLLREVDQSQHPKSDISVRQAVEQWSEVVELEATTRERYDDLIRLYILPAFGDLKAAKLDAELLERFYARLHRCRELCSGKAKAGHVCRPLSSSTTRKMHYILRGALERAVRWRHLSINPAAMAEAPVTRRSEPDPPDAGEAVALLNASWNDPEWGLLLWLAMLTGPRRGELSALRWRHFDLERGVMWVQQSNAQPRSGLAEKATKTNQRRKVALDEHTVTLLQAHRERWQQRCEDLEVPFTSDVFVFSIAPDGSEPYRPRAISQRYRRLAERLKLRSTRFHALRHYSATELVAAGFEIQTIAGRLGHGSSATTTLKTYSAWVDEADKRAASAIGALLPKPVPTPRTASPYETIAKALRECIRSGELRPGDELPTVVEIAAANAVAVGTAHRALAALKAEGLVTASRGRRAIVSSPSP